MGPMNFVYEVRKFKDDDLFKRIADAGYDVEDILFGNSGREKFRDEINANDDIPKDILEQIKGDANYLCFCVNRGRGAGDGILEDPHQGKTVIMYDGRIVRPFLTERQRTIGKEMGFTLEHAHQYYARSAKELQEAIVGIIKFV